MIELYPGFATRRFEDFTGPPDAPISFVGRHESLAEDLVRALRIAGEEFNEAALRAVAPVNHNDYSEHRAHYDLALAREVIAAEHDAIERWYADDPLPARFLRQE